MTSMIPKMVGASLGTLMLATHFPERCLATLEQMEPNRCRS